MPIIIQNDGSAEYIGAVIYADQQRWCQAVELASNQLGPEPCAVTSWQAHAAYMADLNKLAKKILRRLN